MKKIATLLALLISAFSVEAQSEKISPATEKATLQGKSHKIVFQFSTEDTLAQKALMKQLNNILTVAPDTKIEVVCHGPGLNMLLTSKSMVAEKISQMTKRGVNFLACEFSMSERNVSKDKIIPDAGFIKAGIVEIVSKQEEGWSYIKSGF
jgi:intracellular sulfur oxidation DsrE/DsrF family protein